MAAFKEKFNQIKQEQKKLIEEQSSLINKKHELEKIFKNKQARLAVLNKNNDDILNNEINKLGKHLSNGNTTDEISDVIADALNNIDIYGGGN